MVMVDEDASARGFSTLVAAVGTRVAGVDGAAGVVGAVGVVGVVGVDSCIGCVDEDGRARAWATMTPLSATTS